MCVRHWAGDAAARAGSADMRCATITWPPGGLYVWRLSRLLRERVRVLLARKTGGDLRAVLHRLTS